MLKSTTVFLLLLITGAYCSAQHFNYERDYKNLLARTRLPNDALHYNKLLSRFRSNDKTLTVYEILCLMIGYTGTPNYRPYQYIKTERRIKELNDKEQYTEVLKACDTFLTVHPLSQQAIIEKAYAHHKLKQTDSAVFYKEQFARIMAAMDWSNDGRTPETAMFAVGQYDGENFIDKYYHADLGRDGSAEDKDGNLCDKLEMKFRKGGEEQSVTFYFIIQHAVNTQQSE